MIFIVRINILSFDLIKKQYMYRILFSKNKTYLLESNFECTASIKIEHMYICTERIFDSRAFMYNKIFLKKTS